MPHERHHSRIILIALLALPTAALAEVTLQPDGGPVTVREGEFPTSLGFSSNSAAAIDQDGNVLVGYLFNGENTRQTVDAFAPNGETARYEAPEFSSLAYELPAVTHILGNLFAVARGTDTGDEFNPGLTVEFLRLSDEQSDSGKAAGQKLALTGVTVEVNSAGERIPLGEVIRSQLPDDCKGTPNFKAANAYTVPDENGVLKTIQRVTVECESKTFAITATFELAFDDNLEAIIVPFSIDINVSGVTVVSFDGGSGKTRSKADLGPPMADPVSATGRRQDIPILAYFGRPESGEFGTIVTLLELGEDPVVTSVLQIDDPIPMGFPEGSIATCGFPDRNHYWAAFATDEGRAVAARVTDAVQDIVDLGPSSGAVDITCDGWGNAVASWADTSNGARVHTAVLGPGGGLLDTHQQGSLGFPELPDADDFRVSNDINDAGEIVVAWTDGNGGDQDQVAFRRLKLEDHFTIDGTLSGSHFAPAFNGEGFIFDIVELEGTPTLVVYYFTYQPDGSGQQAWLVGSGPIEDNRAVAEVVAGSGATFGDAFDPEDVTRTPAGTVTATFLSCGLVQIETASELFANLAYIAQPLTGRPLSVDGQCGQGPDGTAQVDASRGGSHFNVGRDGEGFIFDIVNVGGEPTLVIYYFTYTDGGSGNPAWLVGQGPIQGDSATATMTIAEGATFGPDFDPADVARTEWGEVTVTWQTCEDVTVEYNGLWGEGSFNVEPLTPPLIGATGLCAP